MKTLLLAIALLLWPRQALASTANAQPAVLVPHAAHVTVVVMENRNYSSVVKDDDAPYFNRVLVPLGVLFTNSHAIEHPSEPNYLDLFSGSNQGVNDDSCPHAFATPNLASELVAAHKSFVGLSESMPAPGFKGCSAGTLYARKHNPWVNFENVPASQNQPYRGFPVSPPSVTWIVPNMCNDMHDCSTHVGDAWLRANVPAIVAWNARHDGLLIVTWDEAEPDLFGNRIPTVLVGPMVTPGTSAQRITHFTVLHTIETIFGLHCIAADCNAGDITGIWRAPAPAQP